MPLLVAAEKGHLEVVVELLRHLDAHGGPRREEQVGYDALHVADREGHHGIVKDVQPDKLILDNGEEVPYGLLVWSTGVGASSFVKIGVDEWFRVPSVPDVFAVGDCCGFLESTGKEVLPALAQTDPGSFNNTVVEKQEEHTRSAAAARLIRRQEEHTRPTTVARPPQQADKAASPADDGIHEEVAASAQNGRPGSEPSAAPEVEVRLFRCGRGPVAVFQSPLCGYTQD
ncbi:hypothetical protein ZWY2020_026448 [Hordeum vulgare]|nr:hypothetical protein ZWY2020_026448 [Hordeum vulgare]